MHLWKTLLPRIQVISLLNVASALAMARCEQAVTSDTLPWPWLGVNRPWLLTLCPRHGSVWTGHDFWHSALAMARCEQAMTSDTLSSPWLGVNRPWLLTLSVHSPAHSHLINHLIYFQANCCFERGNHSIREGAQTGKVPMDRCATAVYAY